MDGERQEETERREIDALRLSSMNQRLEYERNELLVQVKEKICRAVAVKHLKER